MNWIDFLIGAISGVTGFVAVIALAFRIAWTRREHLFALGIKYAMSSMMKNGNMNTAGLMGADRER